MPSDQQPEIQAIRDALAARPDVGRTHWDGCATDPRHRDCALRVVLAALSRVQQAYEAATRQRDEAVEAQCVMSESLSRVQQERDEAVLRLLNRDGIAACGHYAVFTLMTVFEDGSERPTCMQCDRDAAQDRAEKAEAERDALQQEIATLRQQIEYIPEVFARAVRTGEAEDVPEGARVITFSDTLARQIESTLRRAILQKGE